MSKYGGLISSFIEIFDLSFPLVPLEDPYKWACRRRQKFKRFQYVQSITRLEKRGFLKVITKRDNKFIKITKKGQLEILLIKACYPTKPSWDGKWRLITYDIPESSNGKRDQFRWLLKRNNFVKLQASVFISPYELNTEAVIYLKQSGLIDFIRIMRVDKIDNDKDLKKKFCLK